MRKDIRPTRDHLVQRSMDNNKPFRTAAQKAEARRLAKMVDGRWVSTAPFTRRAKPPH